MTNNSVLKVRNDLIFEMSMEGYTNEELSIIFNLETESISRIVDTLWSLNR